MLKVVPNVKLTIWTPLLLGPQFYIQLVYRANLPFTLTSKNLSFSLIWTKKVYFKAKIKFFLTFILINFFVHTTKPRSSGCVLFVIMWKKKPSKELNFSKIEEIPCQNVPNSTNSCCQMWLIDQPYMKLGLELKCKIYNHWQVYCIFISSLLFLQKRQMSQSAQKTLGWNYFWRSACLPSCTCVFILTLISKTCCNFASF